MTAPARPPEDVSCRVIGNTIDYFQRHGKPVGPLLRGLHRTPEELLDPGGWVSWDEYLTFVRNCDALVTRDEFIEMSTALRRSPLLAPLFLAAGLWLDPGRYFAWAADPKDGGLRHLFPCLETNLAPGDGGVLTVTVRLRPGLNPPPDTLWEAIELAFVALPTHFGLPPATVHRAPVPGGADYAVRPPRRRPLRFALSWVASWFHRNRSAEALAALTIGYERNRRLEAEVAEHRAEAARAQAERRLRQVADAVPGVVYRYSRGADGSERFEYVSAGVERLTGVTAAEAEGDARLMWATAHPDDAPGLIQSVLVSHRDRTPWDAEFRVIARDGTRRWVRGRATPEPDEGTGRVVWNGLMLDVTAEKAAEERAVEQAARVAALAASSNVIIEELDRDGVIRYANRGSAGRTPDDLIGRPIFDLLEPADRESGRRIVADVFATGHPFAGTFAARDGTGDLRHYSLSVAPVRAGGAVERLALTAFDVTDRVRAEAALRESEGRFRLATDASQGMIYDLDLVTGRVFRSPGLARLLGYAPDELAATPDGWVGLVHPDDRPRAVERMAAALAGVDRVDLEYRVLHRDGHYIDGWDRALIVRDAGGRPVRVVGSLLDVSERKRAEEGLRTSDALLRKLSELVPGAFYQFQQRPDGTSFLPFASDGFRRTFEVDPEAARETADPLFARIHPDDGGRVAETVRRSAETLEPWHCEFRVELPAAGRRWLAGQSTPERLPDGGTLWHGYISDVTDRKRAEEALRESEEQLRLALAVAELGVLRVDYRADQVHLSHRAAELFDLPAGAPLPRAAVHARIHPDDRPEADRHIARAVDPAGDGLFVLEHRVARADGSVGWVSVRKRVRFDAGGPVESLGVVVDVTARRRAEEGLREQATFVQGVLDAMSAHVAVLDRTGRIVAVNAAWSGFADRNAAPFDPPPPYTGIGSDYLDVCVRASGDCTDGRSAADAIRRVMDGRSAHEGFDYACHSPAERRWFLMNVTPLRRGRGEVVVAHTEITALRLAEERLRESEERLRLALDGADLGSWDVDLRTGAAVWNRRHAAAQGYGPDGGPRTIDHWQSLVHPDDLPQVTAAADEARRTGRPFAVEHRHRRADTGEERWLALYGRFTYDGGEPVRFSGVSLDVTARKRAETELRESEGRLRLALSAAAAVAFVWDAATDAVIRYFSTEPALPANPSAPEPVAAVRAQVHPDDLAAFDAGVAACLAAGTEYRNSYRVVRPGGSVRWLDEWGTLERDAAGRPLRLTGIAIDVTDRVRAEAGLRESEERLRLALEAARLGTFDWDLGTDRVVWSGTHYALFGYDPGDRFEVRFRHFADRLHPDDRERVGADIAAAREGRRPYANEARIVLPDGTVRWVAGSGEFWYGPDGTPVRMLGTTLDITDRKRAEERLREREEFLRRVTDVVPAVLYVYDLDAGRNVWGNRGVFDSLGYTRDQLDAQGAGLLEAIMHPDDWERYPSHRSRMLALGDGEAAEFEYRVRHATGPWRWMSSRDMVFRRDPDGRAAQIVGAALDITDRKRAEERLQASEARYRTLIETCSDAIFLIDTAGCIRAVNPAAARMHGWTADELTAMRIQDLDLPGDAAQAPERMRRLLAGEVLTFEVEHRRRDGSVVPLEVLASAVELDGEWLILSFDRDITDRRRAEAELRAERDRLALVLDRMPVGCVMSTPDLRFTYWNPGAERIFGYTAAEALGRSAYDLIIPPAARSVVDPALVAVAAGEHRVVVNENRTRDGRATVCEWTNAPLLGPDGRLEGYLAMVQDITERQRAEAAVREAEARQRLALDAARMGTWDLDLTTGRAVWDARQQELFGFAPGEFDGDVGAFYRLLHPDDRPRVEAEVAAAVAGGPPYEGEFRVLPRPGQTRWLYGRGRVVRGADGRPARMVGINYDVTARRQAEAALRVSEERLRQVVENARVVIWEADPATLDFTYVSDFGEALLGFPAADWLAPGFWRARLHPDDAEAAVEFCRTCTSAGRDHRFEYRMVRADGAVVWVDDAVRLLHRDGRLVGIQGAIIDITDRKRTEEALRTSEERLQEAQRIARLGSWEVDLGTGRSWWSDEEYRIFGVTPEAYIPHPDRFPQLIHPDDRAAHRAVAEGLIAGGGSESLQFRIVRPDGSVRHVYEEARIEARPGAAPLLRGVSQDVTDRAEADLALRASLQEKVVMLKEIHHRVKNNLQIITSLLSLQAGQVTHPAAAAVLSESQNRVRAMALVHEALYQSDDLARVNLARYLGELCEYLFRAYGADPSRVRLELAVEPVAVPLDKTIPCGLVVNEVVSNALKYAFPGGRPGTVGVRLAADPRGHLTLTLWDDGVGLPAAVEVGNTPSLGLQLVTILTDQLGGHLTVGRSGGTRFDIAFAP